MSDNIISMRNLRFSFPSRNNRILNGLDIDIPRGKIAAVMGGSGSGKTTLLRLITGQYKPTPGSEVTVYGQRVDLLDTSELYKLRRRMGKLFQFSGLFTDISVKDNIAFPLREHTELPESLIDDLVLLKLESVGLRAAANRYPTELSGGQQRRIALARATALDPKLLLYDEPFAGLDPVSLTVIAELIKKLNDTLGATSVVITHDVDETFSIADHVFLLWQGNLIASGTPDELRRTDDPFVHQFINAKADGPLPFHMPGAELRADLRLTEL